MNKIYLGFMLLLLFSSVVGQNNTNSPYSVFGIGEINEAGGAMNVAMGGAGLALRSDIFLNMSNPASLTAIERKSFGFDMGLNMKYTNLENDYKSANVLNGNISWVQIGFPILDFLAAGITLNPKSNVGYSIYSSKFLEGTNTSYPVIYTGEGGMSEGAFSLGLKCLKTLSIGATSSLIWGNTSRQNEELPSISNASSIIELRDIKYSGLSLKSGFQFYQNITPKINFTLGGMAEYSGELHTSTDYALTQSNGSSATTILSETDKSDNMKLPVKFGMGIALTFNQKTTFTFDYSRSDWTDANVNLSSKKLNINNSYNLGIEISPKYDVARMGQRVKYRAGAFYQTGYINIYGIPIDSYAATLGMSVPIRRDKNSINFSIEAGRQGTLQNQLVRESYLKLNCSFNLWERWFVQRVYD